MCKALEKAVKQGKCGNFCCGKVCGKPVGENGVFHRRNLPFFVHSFSTGFQQSYKQMGNKGNAPK